MNRRITNSIRFCMDELLPPLIRDSRWFMFPFYTFAYRTVKLKRIMNFKKLVHSFTPQEYSDFYNGLNTISRNRKTDLNQGCINAILSYLDNKSSIIDIGCGKGYLLNLILEKYPTADCTGFDIIQSDGSEKFKFVRGNVEKLPFPDKSFDIVLCNHTIEHLLSLDKCVSELIRIARKKVIIVTPKQRYYYYTLDEHVNFFPFEESLVSKIPIENYDCQKIQGDWFYVGNV